MTATLIIDNRLGLAPANEVRQAVAAAATLLNGVFGAAWSMGRVQVTTASAGPLPPASDHRWIVSIMGLSDAGAGILGYHSWSDQGVTARVFHDSCLRAGEPWIAVLLHEAMELAINPQCDRWVIPQGSGVGYILEVCDPCEFAPRWTLESPLGPVEAPDFALPHYFRPGAPGPYSYRNQVAAPLAPGASGEQSTIALGAIGLAAALRVCRAR